MTGVNGFLTFEDNDSEIIDYLGRDGGEEGLQAEHPDETPLKCSPGDTGYHHPEFWGGISGACDSYHLRFLRHPGQGQESLLAYRHVTIWVAHYSLVRQGAEPMGPEGGIDPHDALQIGIVAA
jgi:hypothetical protein